MNIVTIDFDIIMSPSIEFYNDLIGVENPIKDFVADFSFLTTMPADLYQYEYLTRFIIMAQKYVKDNIYFITDHKYVIDILKKLPHNEPINLINIDHHHDLGYDDKDWNLPSLKWRGYNCGNWVRYSKETKLIDNYCWVKNENSQNVNPKGEKYIDQELLFKESKLEENVKSTNVLILCASYEWIPPLYHPLFLNWQTICEEFQGKEFSVDIF